MTLVPRIDAHFDAGGLDGTRSAEAEDVRREIARERIDGIVVVQSVPSLEQTRRALGAAIEEPLAWGVVAWVDLASPDLALTIESLRAGVAGDLLAGLVHPVAAEADGDWLRREGVRRGLKVVERSGLALDLLVRTRDLPAVLDVARAFPDLRIVIDHLGAPPISSGDLSAWGRALLPLADLPNVCAKLSGLVTEADPLTWSIDDLRHPVELAVDAFGTGRLCIGSDWPNCLAAGSYTDVIDVVRYMLAELPAHEQDDVLGGTAARLYRLRRATVA